MNQRFTRPDDTSCRALAGMFIDAFGELDRLLRGDATRLPALKQGTIDIPAVRVAAVGGGFWAVGTGCAWG